MEIIQKHPITLHDRQKLSLPENAHLLCVRVNRNTGQGCIYALVDTGRPSRTCVILTFGTDHSLPSDLAFGKYLGTYETPPLTWHVFYRWEE